MSKAVSNEKIIAALMSYATIKDAAAAAGVSTRTIYDRMQDRGFRSELMTAKTEILRQAVSAMQKRLTDAVEAVAAIMDDPETNPAVRLQAAQTILNNAGKFADRLCRDENNARNEAKDPADWLSMI